MSVVFNPASALPALLGGVLIGASAGVLVLGIGRVAGISGIVGRLLSGPSGWQLAFLVGLLGAPWLLTWATGARPAFHAVAGTGALVLSGLLVGFGSRLGSGCTSGHGVCGLARLSPRSLAATAVFMLAGMATVALLKGVGA